jgi:hypothetical protein
MSLFIAITGKNDNNKGANKHKQGEAKVFDLIHCITLLESD